MGQPNSSEGEQTGVEPALPRRSGNPKQQLEAIRKVQNQAEQRVKLGMKLFEAAEARVVQQRELIDQVKGDQKQLREQVNEDVAKTLHDYDQWIGQIDEGFTNALRTLEERIDHLQGAWDKDRLRLDAMMKRSEALLDQTRLMLSGAAPAAASSSPDPPPVTQAMAEPGEIAHRDPARDAPRRDESHPDQIYSRLLDPRRSNRDQTGTEAGEAA